LFVKGNCEEEKTKKLQSSQWIESLGFDREQVSNCAGKKAKGNVVHGEHGH